MNLNKVEQICSEIKERISRIHIQTFNGMEKPLFLISDCYPGIWMEHVYDSIFYAKMNPAAVEVAKNTVNIFMDFQTEDGQLPCFILNEAVAPKVSYSHIQECVSFPQLCFEVYELSSDLELLKRSYHAAQRWVHWLRTYRMTSGRGLIEMFVGYDTGHDESARLTGLTCPGNWTKDGQKMNAGALPENDPVAPILAVDMNCNFYATHRALEKMARALNLPSDAEKWAADAAVIKQKLFEHCYNEEDAFFYDVDKCGHQRKYLSSTIFHLFLEKVLDPKTDADLITKIYTRHIKNPDEFWTPYPFPSMAVCDPACKNHPQLNCWGYYSQGLIALRCTRWMDAYGMNQDFDVLCKQWLKAWTDCFDTFKLGQELDPISGQPTLSSQWYSSCMLFYLYAAKRLGYIDEI